MRPSRTAAFFVHIVGRTRARRAVGRSLRDKPFPRYHATHGRDYPPPPEKGTRNTSPHDYFNYICTGIKHVTTMKAKTATTLMAAASLTLLTSACGRQAQPPRQQQEPQTQQTDVELRDYGAEPTVLNIDSYTPVSYTHLEGHLRAADAEKVFDDVAFALGERLQRPVHLRRERLVDQAAVGIGRIGVDEHVEQAVVLAVGKGGIDRDVTPCLLYTSS